MGTEIVTYKPSSGTNIDTCTKLLDNFEENDLKPIEFPSHAAFFESNGANSTINIINDPVVGLNNLINISMDEKYSTMLGYTQEELENYFPGYIETVAKKQSMTRENTLERIKFWYNGYRFSEAKLKVYNPYSTLSLFEHHKFINHWFSTGTPTFLLDLIKRDKSEAYTFEDEIDVAFSVLDTYDVESLPLIPIMFDAGYLTISHYMQMNGHPIYTLALPNEEVRTSVIDYLLPLYSERDYSQTNIEIVKISKAILANDLDKFFSLLKSYFASIPYDIIPKKNLGEKYFQLIFYLLMRVSSFRVNTEDRTSLGRIDLVLESDTSVYLFELKVDSSAQAALEQIKEKKYYEKYLNIQKEVLIIGVNFSLEERNVTDWVVESLGL